MQKYVFDVIIIYYILYVQISAAFAMYAPTCVIAYSDVSVKVMFYLCHWEDFLKWLANHKPDRHWQSLCQPRLQRPRFFTRRECARIMGFPEDYVFANEHSPSD
jgi:hypothetical protein